MSKVFTSDDYNSNDGMLTTIWGPALWHTLHTMSFNYPVKPTVDDKKHYREFIESLRHVLPCGACRKNLVSNLEKVPLTAYALSNRTTFSRWLYKLHEQVNTMLGKKSGLSYADIQARYENFRARCALKGMDKKPPKIESGCVEPLEGIKSKCVITIVPNTKRCGTFIMDEKCQVRKK